jgi:hypothetical protein
MIVEPLANGKKVTITDIASISVFDADPRLMNSLDGVFCKVLKIHKADGEIIIINLFADESRYLNVRRGDRV